MLLTSRQSVAAVRSDSRDASNANVSAYMDAGGSKLALTGDDEAVFSKAPPFPRPFTALAATETLTASHTPSTSPWPLLDVTQARALTLAFDWTPSVVGNFLNLIVYNVIPSNKTDYSNALYFPLSFGDGVVASSTQAPFTQPFNSRTISPLVIRSRAALATTTYKCTLEFDGVNLPSIAGLNVVSFTATETLASGSVFGTLGVWGSARC